MKIPTPEELRPNLKAHVYDYTVVSDQQAGKPKPANFKDYDPNGVIIDLPDWKTCPLMNNDLTTAFLNRKSQRIYTQEAVTLAELSYLLYFTQGVRNYRADRDVVQKVVPSAGSRHSLETYLVCLNVEGLEKGVYRYLGKTHQLLLVKKMAEGNTQDLFDHAIRQKYAATSGVLFLWSTVPYRSEWRYAGHAEKVILLDAGHVCQNLYLAADAVGCGTVAIGAYNQDECDQLCDVDGEDEFVIYAAIVGKVKH